jgi:hypothetical protein
MNDEVEPRIVEEKRFTKTERNKQEMMKLKEKLQKNTKRVREMAKQIDR